MTNYAVIRGTTPTFRFTLKNYELNKANAIHVTFRQNDKILIKKEYELEKREDDNRIDLTLSQEETLMFQTGIVQCQIRLVSLYDDAMGTEIFDIPWNTVLEEGVIE